MVEMSGVAPVAPTFSLERFERAAWRREQEPAWRELLRLLGELDAYAGIVGPGQPPLDRTRCTRVVAALSCLLTDPALQFSPTWLTQVLALHRWINHLFQASAFGSADPLIAVLNTAVLNTAAPGTAGPTLAVAPQDLVKFCLLYGAESALPLDLDALFRHDRALAVGLALALLACRVLATPAAHAKREQLLPWVAEHLGAIDDVSALPFDVLHDVYMQCSYALRPDKHEVKRAISALLQRALQQRGLDAPIPFALALALAPVTAPTPVPAPAPAPASRPRPVMLVVVEWLRAGHSIMRTHSLTIEAARAHFEIVGMGYGSTVDAMGRAVFDRFVEVPREVDVFEQVRLVRAEAMRCRPSLLYMPSVGMSQLCMVLANVRLAPLQVMSTGHPGAPHAAAIDRVLVEHDFTGDKACFGVPLLELPVGGLPYRPAVQARRPTPAPRPHAPVVVNIALPATVMKFNPVLLSACAAIVRCSPVPVHFHVLAGQAQGVLVPALLQALNGFLGAAATLHPQQDYEGYMAAIEACDMFVNPFPFGNNNGNIDCIGAGLVGVCKSGPEVHEHGDGAMFRRLGWPEWLIAPTVEAYIDAAVRLACSHDERAELRARLSGPEKAAVFYSGQPELMGEMFLQALKAAVDVNVSANFSANFSATVSATVSPTASDAVSVTVNETPQPPAPA